MSVPIRDRHLQPRLRQTSRSLHSFFLLVIAAVLIAINLGLYSLPYLGFNAYTFFYLWLVEFVALGFAYEIAELVLLLFLRDAKISRLSQPADHPAVALVCCTCDDINQQVLEGLTRQTYPNLHIFILDDSQKADCRRQVDSLGLTVIRRTSRDGYKAGNLNNWLFHHAKPFQFFVVSDADSVLPDRFVEEMVCYATHADNSNIALFESLIQTWNTDNGFAYLQSVMAPISHRQRMCLGNRMQSMLSAGHNNLYRTSRMLEIGGFNEDYLAEDYATTIELLRKGWMCMTVPIISYERSPANLNEYAKRSARYAYQTFQLMSLKVNGVPWASRLRLVKDLHSYCLPVLAVTGILFLIILALQYFAFTDECYSLEFNWLAMDTAAAVFWLSFIFLPVLLRGVLALREKISLSAYLRTTIFHSALFTCTLWPTIRRLATFFTGTRSGFDVTATEAPPSLRGIWRLGAPGFVLSWIAFLVVLVDPIASIMNLIWIGPAIFSPLIIHHYQKTAS